MNHPTIMDAIDRVSARKAAAGVMPGDWSHTSDVRSVLIGTDLTTEDLGEVCQPIANAAILYTLQMGPAIAGSALWSDGLLTGLELAAMRQQAEARADTAAVAEARDVRSSSRDLVVLLEGAAELLADAGAVRCNPLAADCTDLAARIRDRIRA